MKRQSKSAACLLTILILTAGIRGTTPVLAASSPAILLEGTIVTMNAGREVIENGSVLVRDGRIVAMWKGGHAPKGVDLTGAIKAPLSPHALIYPGLINLHDHPFYDVLPMWQPPSSHRQPAAGRPLGTESYDNRYQWNSPQSPEIVRLISNPSTMLTNSAGLDELTEVLKYGEARMILGGTTTTQGGSGGAYDSLLTRNVEGVNFGRQKVFSRVPAIGLISASDQALLQGGMAFGFVDAFLVHLAEGVRDADRHPGDLVSSRAEFSDLKARHLLNDTTVIVHGVGLEPSDFVEMAHAPAARADGVGDGRGAKLVWSPLSNLMLYGKTAAVSDAIAAGVVVSLGTDWTPSGSPNLLTELKVADRVLSGQIEAHGADARARDQRLVEMVTINPAMAVRWDDQVGSIETGKVADILVIDAPGRASGHDGVPESPYRRLIDATEQDVALVLVGGVPQAGDVDVMTALKPGDFEIVHSDAGCFDKAIDVTLPSVPQGNETLAQIAMLIGDGLRALGADPSRVGSGPSFPSGNTWNYLQAHIPGASGLPDYIFPFALIQFFGTTPEGMVNLEAMSPPPLFTADDHWWFASLEAARDAATGLTADAAPPYKRYASNANQETVLGNPFAAPLFHDRWYSARCEGR